MRFFLLREDFVEVAGEATRNNRIEQTVRHTKFLAQNGDASFQFESNDFTSKRDTVSQLTIPYGNHTEDILLCAKHIQETMNALQMPITKPQ